MFVRSGDGYVEVGVVSWGYGDSPNVYARVSAYRDWIAGILGEQL